MEIINLTDAQKLYLLALQYECDVGSIHITDAELTYLYSNNFIQKNYTGNDMLNVDLKTFLAKKVEPIDKFIKDYNILFDKSNIGIIGKKGDEKAIRKKLEQFLKEYPETTFSQILDATNMYLNHMLRTTNPRYIMESHYFIYKIIDKAETSNLRKWITELTEEGQNPASWDKEIV